MITHAYTREDFKNFAVTVCDEHGLKSLKSLIDFYDGDPSVVHSYIEAIKSGRKPTHIVNVTENITESQIKFHENMYRSMYDMDLRATLKLVNEDKEIQAVMRWRLKIGK